MMIALMILKKLPSEIGSLRNADLLNGCSIVVETKNDETDPWEVWYPSCKHSTKCVTDSDNLQIIVMKTTTMKTNITDTRKEASGTETPVTMAMLGR